MYFNDNTFKYIPTVDLKSRISGRTVLISALDKIYISRLHWFLSKPFPILERRVPVSTGPQTLMKKLLL